MNDLELKNLWQRQAPAPAAPAAQEELIMSVRKKMKKLDHNLFWRDIRELAACAFAIFWFGHSFSLREPALAIAGRILIVLGCLLVAAKLLLARRHQKPAPGVISVRESLAVELEKVRRQIGLLRSVLWWYILPILTGSVLFFCGLNSNPVVRVAYIATCVFIGVVLVLANRFAVKRHLLPLQLELEQTIAAAPEFSLPEPKE